MTTKKLDSGYWLVWWNCNRWIQWPCGRAPRIEDAFGWVTATDVRQAAALVEGEQP